MTDVNPEMLRLARVSRGKSQTEVAEALGIKQPTYSKMEGGQVSVRPDHLVRLTEALRFPVGFFAQRDRIWGTASPHHRKLKSLPRSTQEQIEAQLNVVRLQLRRLSRSVQLDVPFQVPAIDIDDVGTASEAALEVRRLWRLPSGPIVNVTRVLEDAGVIILRSPMPAKFDAMSIWGPGESPVVLANASYPVDRGRHTYAHELAHLCLHASDVSLDPESEAGEFAREFLMPAREILPEMRDLKLHQLPDMKRRWKCSMRSIVYHAAALGAITKPQARYLYIKMNSAFGAQREPVDLPPEPPSLMKELVDGHMLDLGYSLDQLESVTNAFAADLRETYSISERHLRSM